MKIWCAVTLYCGICEEIKCFATDEAAKHYFDNFVEECGGVDRCDPDHYEDGSNGVFYWWDGDDDEITIQYVEVEG